MHPIVTFIVALVVGFLAMFLFSAAVRAIARKMKPGRIAAFALLAFASFACFAGTAFAAEKKSILSEISVSAVGAYEQAEFTGGPAQYGAGLDLGLPVNSFVSLHVRALGFEGAGDTWRGSTVDETTFYGRADFVSRITGEKFRLYGTGGGTRHFELEDWSFGVGLGAEYRFTKNISLSAAREVRAYFGDTDRTWLSTASLTFRF